MIKAPAPDQPGPPPAKPRVPAADPREARLKAALKANLSRRKAQARARSDDDPAPAGSSDD